MMMMYMIFRKHGANVGGNNEFREKYFVSALKDKIDTVSQSV